MRISVAAAAFSETRRHVDRVAGDERLSLPPTTTSPVLTPIRASRPCSRRPPASPTLRAQRAQRVVLVRDGDPEDGHDRIPHDFSTTPPWRSTIARRSSKYRRIRARRASGSVDSPSAVEPTRSQKRTVTTLRCSRVGSTGASAVPRSATEARIVRVLTPAARATRHGAEVYERTGWSSASSMSAASVAASEALNRPAPTSRTGSRAAATARRRA